MAISVKVDWNKDGDFSDTSEDVTSLVRRTAGISFEYGRDQMTALAPTVAGRGSVTLNNHDRTFSPRNTGSPLFGLIKPARPVKVTRAVGADTYTLFVGHTDDNPINPDLDSQTVSLSLVDSLADFRGVTISTPLYRGIRTGEAIGYILDAAGWPGTFRNLDAGATVIPWFWEAGTDALTALENVLRSEGPPAMLTMSADGHVVFKDRHHRLTDSRALTSQSTWVDASGITAPVMGLNVAGGEFGTIPGTYDTDYHYDGQTSLNALFALGIRHVRVPIKMERLQPTLGAAFDATEQTRITDYVTRIATAGMTCKVEAHNYARRVTSGVEYTLGHANYTQSHHVDFFSRLGALFASSSTVTQLGYNEPHDISDLPGTFTPTITHYNFDASIQGWAAEGAATVSHHTGAPAMDGAGKLRYQKTFGAGTENIRGNDSSGLADDISSNGVTVGMKFLVPSGAAGSGFQGRIEIQNSSFAWQQGPWFPLTAGTITEATYTPSAGLLANCRAIGFQVEATGVSGTFTVYVDTVRQGSMVGALTGAQQWQAADQAAYTAVVAAGFTGGVKEYHASGYSWSGAKDYQAINGDPWITETLLPVRYEAHSYGDNDRSGTYGSSYATETANAATDGYTSVGNRWVDWISDFTTWCDTHNVDGVIGEIGWPDDPGWNVAGAQVLHAVVANFDVTYWAVGEWWGTGYALSPWEWTGSAYSANGQAAVLLDVLDTSDRVMMNKPFIYDEAWRNIINTGSITVGTRTPSELIDVWTSDAPLTFTSGEVKRITASASDPFYGAITPVQDTDYTLLSGSIAVSLSRTSGAATTIELTSTGPSVLTNLKLRAHSVPVAYSIQVELSDGSSVGDYGARSFPGDLPWCNEYDAEAVLSTAIALRAEPVPIIQARFVLPETDLSRVGAVLTRDLSDRVTIIESETVTNGDFYIESISHEFTSEFDHTVTFGVEAVPTTTALLPFRFDDDDAGFDEGFFVTAIDESATMFTFDDDATSFDFGVFAT